jgi:hypothetical protein
MIIMHYKTSTITFNVERGQFCLLSCDGWMTRPSIMIQMLEMYIKEKKIDCLPLINIDLSDDSTDVNNFPKELYLTISATMDNRHRLLPDPYSLCWPEAIIHDVFEKCQSIASAGEKQPVDQRLFWIGQNSHWTRPKLIDVSQRYPDKIHARILEWEKYVIPQNDMVSLEDHTKYKYLIDLPGQGYSARIKYLLFSRRPLFIVAREYHDWISCDIKPWIHYIPVNDQNFEDDLLGKLEWAQQNPTQAQNIADNAFLYITNKLTLNNIIEKIHDCITKHIAHL